MGIKRIGYGACDAGADLSAYKKNVDNIYENGVFFMLHVGIGDTWEQELEILPALIDYIKSKK